MDTEKFLLYDTKDFILDDDFRRWVLHPDTENKNTWNDFLYKYPDKKKQINDAVLIIKAIQPEEPEIPSERLHQILYNIKPDNSPFRRITVNVLKYAAVLILLVSIGGLIFYFSLEKDRHPYAFEPINTEVFEKGRIILSDGTVREFETEETKILQTKTGAVTVNNDTVNLDVNNMQKGQTIMNQVIIPYGKRSEITLADGTHIWLNSGSQITYPFVFTGDTREVYLSGEAFFDVETDHSRPFYVITENIKLKVLGTTFNVTSYENDQTTNAVLLTGKISVEKNKLMAKTVELSPGERIVYDKMDESMVKSTVDVNLYSSWINGYLIFVHEPLNEIFKKLERYYNRKIVMEEGLKNFTFSGKLDLMDDIEIVLENISYTTSFSIEKNKDYFTIKALLPVKKN